MEKRRVFRNILCGILLAFVPMIFSSCEAVMGGNITFGYFVGCIVYGAIGLIVGGLLWFWGSNEFDFDDNYNYWGWGWLVVPACAILPLLWRPAEKFNFIMMIVNISIGILARISPYIFDALTEASARKAKERELQAEMDAREEQEQKKAEIERQIADTQDELDEANRRKENARNIATKQRELCRNIDTFKQLVNDFADSMHKNESYDFKDFSEIESRFIKVNESVEYVPVSALSEFKDSCVFLDGIIKNKLNNKECSDIERLKFAQMQEKLAEFLSCDHKSGCEDEFQNSTVDAMRGKIHNLNNKVASLTEKLRTTESDFAQKEVSRLLQHAEEAAKNRDYQTALEYWSIAAEGGDANAQYMLGQLYRYREGYKDFAEAERYFRFAANQGHAGAQYELGKLYLKGKGVEVNYQEAVNYFRRAASQGYGEAIEKLGKLGESLNKKTS